MSQGRMQQTDKTKALAGFLPVGAFAVKGNSNTVYIKKRKMSIPFLR